MPENYGRFDENDPRFQPPFLFTHQQQPTSQPLVTRIEPNHRRLAILLIAVVGVILAVSLAAYSAESSDAPVPVPSSSPTDLYLDVAATYGFWSGKGSTWESGVLSMGYDICDEIDFWNGDIYTVIGEMVQDNHRYGNGTFTYEGVTALVKAAEKHLC